MTALVEIRTIDRSVPSLRVNRSMHDREWRMFTVVTVLYSEDHFDVVHQTSVTDGQNYKYNYNEGI